MPCASVRDGNERFTEHLQRRLESPQVTGIESACSGEFDSAGHLCAIFVLLVR